MERIALIEDDKDLAFLVKLNLEREGFEVEHFERATPFFKFISENSVDLILIDIMLPDLDGFRIANFLKSRADLKEIPVIFITAKGEEEDKLKGFELGADDYITKPFSMKELIARVRAVLKRYKKVSESKVLKYEGVELDTERQKLFVDGREVYLTPAEFKILKTLMENFGRPVSRSSLVEKLWDYERETTERAIDVHVKHIRDKLGKYKGLIKTVRGVGYKFEN
ncbi:response regulator transcription factor [Aquifex aeolicus]|nr:response regulator transcription factor [Aquifex aeolicus]